MPDRKSSPTHAGPFRLVKYFIVSGFALIAIATAVLGAFLYTRSIDTLVRSSENYARLLAANLNYKLYSGFYAPLKARALPMDLGKWDQFGTMNALIKDFMYGLKIDRLTIVDKAGKVIYSTEYDLVGKYEPRQALYRSALRGEEQTVITKERSSESTWRPRWLAKTYFPLREITGNLWMQGNIYGVAEITQDVTDQYFTVQKSIMVVIGVAAGLMVFLFVALTVIVKRGEDILFQRAQQEQRLQEKLQQSEKMASLGQMVATIAHEIRNPLGIIKSSAEVLAKKENPNPQRVKKLSTVIVEEATRLSAILTDFLDFAKPRSPERRPVNVAEVVYRVESNLEHELLARQAHWINHDLNGFDPVALADSNLLYQAFLNVAMNALDAMEDGGELRVTVNGDKDWVRVRFEDTGHGIEEEDVGKIFTPFFTTHEMGTGLGLSVVHNIVTAHGGEIWPESVPEGGAAFIIQLPRGSADKEDSEVFTPRPNRKYDDNSQDTTGERRE